MSKFKDFDVYPIAQTVPTKDQMDEKFGADCNHEGQSFLCKPCADAEIKRLKEELESHAWEITPAMAQAQIDALNAQLAEATAELSEQESRANRWMTGCQLAREQLAEARLALRLIDIEGVDQRVRDVAQAALEVKDNG